MRTEELLALTGADGGSIGPINLKGFRIIADKRLEGVNGLISGANRNDYHIANIDLRGILRLTVTLICGPLKQENLVQNVRHL